jgi:hypothetical protein
VVFIRNPVPQDEMTKVVPRDIDRVAHAIDMRHTASFLQLSVPRRRGRSLHGQVRVTEQRFPLIETSTVWLVPFETATRSAQPGIAVTR